MKCTWVGGLGGEVRRGDVSSTDKAAFLLSGGSSSWRRWTENREKKILSRPIKGASNSREKANAPRYAKKSIPKKCSI